MIAHADVGSVTIAAPAAPPAALDPAPADLTAADSVAEISMVDDGVGALTCDVATAPRSDG